MPGQFGMMPQNIADPFSERRMGGAMTPLRPSFGQTGGSSFMPKRPRSSSGGMDPRLLDILHALLQSQPPGSEGGGFQGGSGDGVGVGRDSFAGLPRFAYGGVVDQPTVGLLGEAGPEAVVPLTKRPYGGGLDWARQQAAGMRAGGGSDAGSTIQRLLAGGSMTFGPDYLRSALRRGAMGTASSMRRRGDVLSRLAGLDPMQQRQAMIDSEREASGGLTSALNNADLQGLSGYQDFIRQLLTGERGYQQQTALQKMQNDAAIAAAKAGKPSILGELAGAGIGAASKFIKPRL